MIYRRNVILLSHVADLATTPFCVQLWVHQFVLCCRLGHQTIGSSHYHLVFVSPFYLWQDITTIFCYRTIFATHVSKLSAALCRILLLVYPTTDPIILVFMFYFLWSFFIRTIMCYIFCVADNVSLFTYGWFAKTTRKTTFGPGHFGDDICRHQKATTRKTKNYVI